MTPRRASRWIAGLATLFALTAASAQPPADTRKADPKWPTTRVDAPEDLDELKALQARVKGVVDKCTPSTVGILIGFGAGSGVIVSEDGLVLTAAHVLTGEPNPLTGEFPKFKVGEECLVVLPDVKKVKAKTLGVNSDVDSGMIQITEKGPNDGKWPFLPVTKSGDMKKGQWVVSLGHPGGPKTNRAPVARLGRVVNNNKDIVRSNCTLVGGDSGGPLFDLDGNVVGIHSRIGLTLEHNIHIPTEQFKKQWDEMAAGKLFGRIAKAGTKSSDPPVVGVVFPEDEEDDAYLVEVEETGPAGKAGLRPGDTITKFNGESVKTVKKFRDLVKDKKPGEIVKFTVRRGTETLTLSVTLGKRM
jgi:serine protease Do